MTERDVFIAALQKKDPAQRQAYLDEACAGQPELRTQVENLLRLHEGAGSFLEKAAAEAPATGAFQEAAEPASSCAAPGTLIGPYKLLEQIGEGGMGTVWMAQQTEPLKRLVAVKLIKAGMDSKQVIARFEAERQALALMDHANIARVLDAGTSSAGRPYFVMDLVKGVPITRYCDEHHLTPRLRLELFIPVCQAIQHAHQKGIIHRDVKPSNVLVALYDGRPVPKVIDFGIAKATGQCLTEKTLVTGFGAIVGTLEYVSPEQAEINQLDIDTRSDVYSLGVLLYELLAGSPPFTRKDLEKAGMLEMLRVIREQEPTKPSAKLSTAEGLPTLAANRGTEPAKLTRLVRGELDWIVMKALEKDRNRRYETANGFAMDLQRYLADEPVQACPPSAWYRLGKLLRRHKRPLLAVSLVVLALVGGIIGTTWGMLHANDAAAEMGKAQAEALADRDRKAAAEKQARDDQGRAETAEKQAKDDRDVANKARDRARLQQYVMGMYPLSRLWRDGSHHQVRDLLEALRPGPGEEDLRGWEWHYQDRLSRGALRTLKGHHPEGVSETTQAVAFSPDGRWLASCGGAESEQGEIFLWDVATGQEVRRFHGQGKKLELVVRVAFSPDGNTLASSDRDNTVQLWDVASGRRLATTASNGGTAEIQSLAFSPDGRFLASAAGEEDGSEDTVRVWEVASRRSLGKWKTGAVTALAFHPEGHLLTVTHSAVTLHEPATGKVLRSFPLGTAAPPSRPHKRDDEEPEAAAVSPDGIRLAVAAADGIWFWDLARGLKGKVLNEHARKDTNGLTFSPDGQRLASAGKDGAVEVWDLPKDCHLPPPPDQPPAGKNPSTEVLYFREIEPTRSTLRVLEEGVVRVAFSPDGLRLAVVGHDGSIRLWDAGASGQESRVFRGLSSRLGMRRLAFTPDGGQFLVQPGNPYPPDMPYLCDALGGQRLPGQKLPGQSGGKGPVAYGSDGRWLATGCPEGIRLWDAATCREVRTIPTSPTCVRLAFVGDGRLVSVLWGKPTEVPGGVTTVHLWDAASGRELAAFKENAVVSPDGRRLASREPSKPPQEDDPTELNVWDIDKWRPGEENKPVQVLRPHGLRFFGLAYSPDGKLLATAGVDKDQSQSVKFWDADTLKEVRSIPWPKGVPFEDFIFSPDGRFLAAGHNRSFKVWEVAGREVFTYEGNEQDMTLAFSPDGRYLAASGRGYVKAWEVTGREVLSYQVKGPAGRLQPRINLTFSPDGGALAASDVEGATRVWDLGTGRERLALKVRSPEPAGITDAGLFLMFGAGVAFSPDGRRLATGNPVTRVWDAASGAELHSLGHVGPVVGVAVSPVGRTVATGQDQVVRLWEPETWKPLGTCGGHSGEVGALAFSPDGHLLAAGDGIWDLTDRQAVGVQPPTRRLNGNPQGIVALAFSPNGQQLFSVGAGSVKVWDVASGRELSSGKLALERVGGVAFSPDGQWLAYGGNNAARGGDNTVRLWDLAKGQEVGVLTVEDKMRRGTTIGALAFSPDGRRLAAVGVGMIRIWDLRTFQELYVIAPAAPTCDLAFSPDGGWLVAVGGIQPVRSVSTPTGGSTLVSGLEVEQSAVVFYDGRPLTPEREVEREALGVLDQLFNRPLPRKDVLDHLRSDPALSAPVRQEALRLAAHYREEEDPKRYADTARTLARSAYLPATWHRQALSQAEAACALAPADGDCLTTLGMAQYRLGQYQEALKTLARADRLNAQKLGGGDSVPADLALLALVHHRLGHEDEADEFVCRLQERMQNGRWKQDEDAGVLLREAELRIHGTMPPWPAGEGTQPAPAEKPKP
jgi:eukaryotic-like serine/threonine-protein kinase